MTRRDALEADALALEHEAVWLYGQIAGRFTALAGIAAASFRHHRAVRDDLLTEVDDDPGPRPAYGVAIITDEMDAKNRAQDLEARLGAVWLRLASGGPTARRRTAFDRLSRSALDRVSWGGALDVLPGLEN